MKYFISIVLASALGASVGLVTALIDAATGLSNSEPNFYNLSAIPKVAMTRDELGAFIFYATEEIGSGIMALLAVIVLAAIYKATKVTTVMPILLVFIFGLVKGGINFALAYQYKIARLDVGHIGFEATLQQSWNEVLKLTVLHSVAGSLLGLLGLIIVKYTIVSNQR